eukprot:4953474-Pyramimonas_sp.AAC.1
MVGSRERWVDAINSKKAVGTFSSSMPQLPLSATGRLATSPSLRAVVGPRRFPKWPRGTVAWRQCRAAWSRWAPSMRLPAPVRDYGMGCWQQA